MTEEIREADEQNVRPWEQPRAVRRDCEPHRGPWILFLGQVCLLLAGLSVCGGITAIPAMPLSVIVWAIAQRDLSLMKQGLMEGEGKENTLEARGFAITGLLVSVVIGTMAGLLLAGLNSVGDR